MKTRISIRQLRGKWLLIGLFAASLASSQTRNGTLTGTVTDPSGAAVPGAAVSLTNSQTRAKHQATTSSSGVYTLSELPFGNYDLSVGAAGFQTAEAHNITISVNQVSRFNVALSVGDVQSSVEVTAEAQALQQDSPTVQTNFSTKADGGATSRAGRLRYPFSRIVHISYARGCRRPVYDLGEWRPDVFQFSVIGWRERRPVLGARQF